MKWCCTFTRHGVLDCLSGRFCLLLGSLLFSSILPATAQQDPGPDGPPIDSKLLPRIPPVEPAQALQTFKVKQGFRLELVAAEPLVVGPVAMSFDENGRLFVVEMRDYPERRPEKLGRIRCLEDSKGEGHFDKSTIYADNLPWPTAVICYEGGVFVGATPDIIFLKDTTGNGIADVRKVVFTGFASDFAPYDPNHLNVQSLFNNFTWGMDNRIHGTSSHAGGNVVSTQDPSAPPLNVRGRDFSFDPRTLKLSAESGGGQFGLTYNDAGRKFVCDNSDHVQTLMYEDRYAGRNPFFAMPAARVSIAVDGPAAEVYRISPEEPWRVLRTSWRVNGIVAGPIEGGGRASGYFTAATGITIYRGNAFPPEFVGDVFVGDVAGNLVHRKKIRSRGVELIAERPADEQKIEFLASKDIWFRPTQLANAPDGTLYVADMYREVIEHPWSIVPAIKKHLDFTSGMDRGRIYRIVPEGFKQPELPHLGRASTAELVATLAHPNGWHRDAAARLLYERQDKSAAPMLIKLLQESKFSLARLQALYTLDGLGMLTDELLLVGLQDTDAVVRTHAVRLTEKIGVGGPKGTALGQKLISLATDLDPMVRYQLAFTLGALELPGQTAALAEIIRRDHESHWVRAALLTSLAGGAGELFAKVCGDAEVANSAGGQEFLRQLLTQIGAQNRPAEVAQAVEYLAACPELEHALASATALGNGFKRAGSDLSVADRAHRLKPLYESAEAALAANQTAEAVRIQAVRFFGLASFSETGPKLLACLDGPQSQEFQRAVINALGRFTDPGLAKELIGRWNKMTPVLRAQVINVLLARPERIRALLQAVADGRMLRANLTSTQREFLLRHSNEGIRKEAIKLLSSSSPGTLQEVEKEYLPALQLAGERAHGKLVYLDRCSPCHRVEGQGHSVGPDLASVRSNGKEKMLINILDPNLEVAPNYVNYLVETKDGESQLGLIASETATSITLRQPGGNELVLLRSNIQKIQSQGRSVMPEGLEKGLKPQDFADLLEYLMTAGQVKPPQPP